MHRVMQAEAIAARKGIALPKEFLAAAAQGGLRHSILYQYALLQVHTFQMLSKMCKCILWLSNNTLM